MCTAVSTSRYVIRTKAMILIPNLWGKLSRHRKCVLASIAMAIFTPAATAIAVVVLEALLEATNFQALGFPDNSAAPGTQISQARVCPEKLHCYGNVVLVDGIIDRHTKEQLLAHINLVDIVTSI